MKRESLVFGVAGVFFGVLVGWILGSQQGGSPATVPMPAAAAAPAAPGAPPPIDVQLAAMLEKTAKAEPANAVVRAELANVFFDAERFDLAIPWYEASLKLDPTNVSASTDLGVCYYNTDQIARALAQFDRSLAVDPRHAKTLLNQGIVRAFGNSDLKGAAESWARAVAAAPAGEEAKQAKRLLDGLKSAHPDGETGGGAAPAGRGRTGGGPGLSR